MTYPDLLDRDIETLDAPEVRKMQDDKWARQWAYVHARSKMYREKFGPAARDVTLDTLQDLPFTGKEDLRKAQENDYPFGTYIACHPDKVVRVHRTSGTTGRALILANSQRDVDIIARQGARGLWASGLRPSDRVVHCLNYQMWTGGVTDHMALEATGATVLPFGVGGTRRLLEVIQELGITAISCTPSYPALLETILRKEMDMDPRDLGLRLALFGGEAGLDNIELRQGMEAKWGFGVRNANFGLSEVMSLMGSQCEHTNDLHFHSSDAVFVELIDPKTEQRLDIVEGASGELVCTHLEKECQPLVRYRTRDVLTITGTGRCGCGRTGFRFRVSGRTDDMFNVRGINIFPSAVQQVVSASGDIASGHFRILLEGPGPYDRIRLRVEAAQMLSQQDWEDAGRALGNRVQEVIGASAIVEMIAFESLQRTDGKTALVEILEAAQ